MNYVLEHGTTGSAKKVLVSPDIYGHKHPRESRFGFQRVSPVGGLSVSVRKWFGMSVTPADFNTIAASRPIAHAPKMTAVESERIASSPPASSTKPVEGATPPETRRGSHGKSAIPSLIQKGIRSVGSRTHSPERADATDDFMTDP